MAKKKAAAKEVERKVLSNGVILVKYDDGTCAIITPISAEDAEELTTFPIRMNQKMTLMSLMLTLMRMKKKLNMLMKKRKKRMNLLLVSN